VKWVFVSISAILRTVLSAENYFSAATLSGERERVRERVRDYKVILGY